MQYAESQRLTLINRDRRKSLQNYRNGDRGDYRTWARKDRFGAVGKTELVMVKVPLVSAAELGGFHRHNMWNAWRTCEEKPFHPAPIES